MDASFRAVAMSPLWSGLTTCAASSIDWFRADRKWSSRSIVTKMEASIIKMSMTMTPRARKPECSQISLIVKPEDSSSAAIAAVVISRSRFIDTFGA
jgi:hypothetical protein